MVLALSTEMLGTKAISIPLSRITKDINSANGVQNPGVPMNVIFLESLVILRNPFNTPPNASVTSIVLIINPPFF